MKLNNKYYILRHGEAVSNVNSINSCWPETFNNPLTENGIKQIEASVKKLRNRRIDFIFSSDILRTKQTARIVAKKLNSELEFDKSSTTFKKLKVVLDKRLREIDFGILNGKPAEELLYLSFIKKKINHDIKKGEMYQNVLKRVSNFIKEIDKKYKRKHILIVSHQAPLWILESEVNNLTLKEGLKKFPKNKRIKRGELRELN